MAPSIYTVDGNLVHGSQVTIVGADFGSKTIAAPVVWDNCDHGQPMSARWDGWYPNDTYYFHESSKMQYSAPIRGIQPAHSRVSKYMRGCGDASGGVIGDVLVWKHYDLPTRPYYTYHSWYHRYDPSWVFFNSDVSPMDNQKIFGHSIGTIPYELGSWAGDPETEPTAQYRANSPGYSKAFYNPSDADAQYAIYCPSDHDIWGDFISLANNESPWLNWVKIEYECCLAVDHTGYIKQWANGRLVLDKNYETDPWVEEGRVDVVGGYCRPYSDDQTQWRYYNDIYYDRSRARVVLGNQPVYGNCTIREPQIPVVWTENNITVTVNLGAFPSSGTAYLFVVNPSGIANDVGQLVTISGGIPTDTIPPEIAITSPTSAATFSTSSSPIALSGTQSDNVAVTLVSWTNDRGGSGSASIGSGTWSIPSIALSPGVNVITIIAYDPSGNSSSDVITITYSALPIATIVLSKE